MTVKTLHNGLTVVVCERPEAPVFSFFTHVDVGSDREYQEFEPPEAHHLASSAVLSFARSAGDPRMRRGTESSARRGKNQHNSFQEPTLAGSEMAAKVHFSARFRLPRHILRISILSKAYEMCVPQVVVWGPFEEFKLPCQHRLQPSALFHFLRGEPLPPPPTSGFRKVCARHSSISNVLNPLNRFARDAGVKPLRAPAAYISLLPS